MKQKPLIERWREDKNPCRFTESPDSVPLTITDPETIRALRAMGINVPVPKDTGAAEKEKMTLDEAIEAYAEKFNDMLPVQFMVGTEEELVALIQDCIESGRPYDPGYDEDVLF